MYKENKDNRDKSISTNRVDATESGINASSIGISNESQKTPKKCNRKLFIIIGVVAAVVIAAVVVIIVVASRGGDKKGTPLKSLKY